jgi:hypothetical protein
MRLAGRLPVTDVLMHERCLCTAADDDTRANHAWTDHTIANDTTADNDDDHDDDDEYDHAETGIPGNLLWRKLV